MDFEAYDNSESIAKHLEDLFASISRPIQFTTRCLLVHGSFQTPKNKRQKLNYNVQIGWTIILSTFVFAAMAAAICTMPPAYYCIYLSGCIDFFFLLYWTRSNRGMEYSKRLKKSSIGVGSLKKIKLIVQTRNVSVAVASVCSLVAFTLLALDMTGVIQLLPKNSISVPKCCFHLLALLLVLFCSPAAVSTVFCYIGSASAEFENIDRDFKHDTNKQQLPVARHYIRGHGQLLKLFEAVSKPVSAWCSAHITLNFIAAYKIICFIYEFDYEVSRLVILWKPAALCFMLVAMLLQTTCIFCMALALRQRILGMRAAMIRVAAGDRLPHEQIFSLFSLHLLDLQQHLSGISFFGLTVIDRHFLNACFIVGSVTAVYCYQRYNRP
ncbi:hypothetical protein Q1695_014121 [Nippostrongylus brasiliensis]|nr:hypothetical protein Q1695_014121 [Nippostrongylus brasiliensis]